MTFNVISFPVKPKYFSQKLDRMKTSVLIAAILLVSIMTHAQQSKTKPGKFDNELVVINDIESSEQTNNTVNLFDKHTIDKPVFKTEFLEIEFNPTQFATNLTACADKGLPRNLMLTVKETLSYSGNLMFINKKYNYTTGMTGKGVGVKLRL